MSTFVVCPYRFSADPAPMIAFLEVLGLRRSVSTEGDGFAVLVADAGAVAVHRAAGSQTGCQPGETSLVFGVESADAAVQQLVDAGLPATVWDESYGRQGGVTDPFGGGIWINEEQTDLYGYRGHDAHGPASGLSVCAVRYSPDFAADQEFFRALGFQAHGHADEWWTPLTAGEGSGIIGLHKPGGEPVVTPAADNPVGGNPLVGLSFETSEPLAQVAQRLVGAGYDARVVDDGALSAVHVTDPDGRTIQIHLPS